MAVELLALLLWLGGDTGMLIGKKVEAFRGESWGVSNVLYMRKDALHSIIAGGEI